VPASALPDDALLTEYQVGALIQVSTNTTQFWRRQPDHPLAWEILPNGLIRYRAGAVRAYLALGRRRQPKPEAAAPKPEAAAPKHATALERAIALLGSQEKLARAAGVHANTIWKALHSCHASRKLALAIEQATDGQVRAEELILEGAQRTPKPEAAAPKNNSSSKPAHQITIAAPTMMGDDDD
jgi:DNA-binding transcriptional regulator YdaS (Cro superfamily)